MKITKYIPSDDGGTTSYHLDEALRSSAKPTQGRRLGGGWGVGGVDQRRIIKIGCGRM